MADSIQAAADLAAEVRAAFLGAIAARQLDAFAAEQQATAGSLVTLAQHRLAALTFGASGRRP